jgi:uncharacterized membrane protein YoaT (DUF817 family)
VSSSAAPAATVAISTSAGRRRLPVFPFTPAALLAFGWQEALSCIFPGGIFVTLALSKALPLPAWLPRYDFILIVCLLLQGAMVAARLESKDEVKVIAMFHVISFLIVSSLHNYKDHRDSRQLG